MQEERKNFVFQREKIICEHKLGGLVASVHPVFHNHDGFEILIFLDGETNFYAEKEGKQLERGDVLLIAPYAFHYAEPLEVSTYDRIVISIRGDLVPELGTDTIDLSSCFSVAATGQINMLHLQEDFLEKLVKQSEELEEILDTDCFAGELLAKAVLTQILVLLNTPLHQDSYKEFSSIMPLPVKNTFLYVQEHLTENFTIREMAETLHHNRDYISRCFKKTTGISLQNYIIAKRISLAQEYLVKGYPPTEVCFLCGFNNYSNFSRTFTNHIGMSPRNFQKSKL